jgi:hypothetical protein
MKPISVSNPCSNEESYVEILTGRVRELFANLAPCRYEHMHLARTSRRIAGRTPAHLWAVASIT